MTVSSLDFLFLNILNVLPGRLVVKDPSAFEGTEDGTVVSEPGGGRSQHSRSGNSLDRTVLAAPRRAKSLRRAPAPHIPSVILRSAYISHAISRVRGYISHPSASGAKHSVPPATR
ncbi:hypothetical protein WA026_010445 [Henosepilachna vigintioctopunctata]|uniref:Uncharacterized protein n=1 Tax=Henosepilachna vigintioctopunctata TaxID=420089 RepID=A0AAW1V6T3_9CUCU